MPNKTRKILISCAVLVLVAIVCISVASLVGAGYLLVAPATTRQGPAPQATFVIPSATPAPNQTGTPRPITGLGLTPVPGVDSPALPTPATGDSNLPPEVASEMDTIQQQVAKLRGLQPNAPVDRRLITREQLGQHISDSMKDYTPEEAKQDAVEAWIFGLLPANYDLYTFYQKVFTEQIAGYYDDETKAMYVIQDEGFQGPEKITYSHEYTHALQDQNYDLKKTLKYSEEECTKDSERCAGVQALIEGDASLSELEWVTTYASHTDIQQYQSFANSYQSPEFDAAPDFIRQDLEFPYQQGQAFVQYLYDQGRWNAVNAAYANPPLSTEQIMHPDRYPNDKPISAALPDLTATLGNGWKAQEPSTLGEWYTYLVLAHGYDRKIHLDDKTAREAAKGWGGDDYQIYTNDQTGQNALVLKMVWDTDADARQFAAAFKRYGQLRFGNPSSSEEGKTTWTTTDGFFEFHDQASQTVFIFAPNGDTAGKLWEQVSK